MDERKKASRVNEAEISHGIEANKKDLIERTSTEIVHREDELASLVSEIKGLNEKIAALDKLVHIATEERKAGHQEFVDMFATSVTAIRLIQKAITRLEKFYSPQKYAGEKKAAEDAVPEKAGLALLHKGE